MNESFIGTIEYLSNKGDGIISDSNQHTYFIPGTWPGDKIKYEIERKAEEKFGIGKCIEIIQPSPDRVTPKCNYQGHTLNKCGGCPWMIGSYQSQLKYKEYRLHYLLKRSGLFDNLKINKIIPSPKELGYRNRCQLKTDGKMAGFVSAKSNEITPINDCLVLNDKTNSLLQAVVKKDWKLSSGKRWNYLDIDELMNIDSVKLNNKRPFLQGNNDQNIFIKSWLQTTLKDENKDHEIIELFAGSGNFTKIISQMNFKQIYALEAKGPATNKLKNNNLINTMAIGIDLYKQNKLDSIPKKALNSTILLVDPPRDGLMSSKKIIHKLNNLQKIIYISCNPETFIKDARFICKNGFTLKEITPIDMFPQTHHLEILTFFTKN